MYTDIEIIEKILKGDMEAFEQLVDRYYKIVYNLVYRMFQNVSDSEDTTQEVFFKIYKNLEKCRGNQSIKTWVYAITYNTCIDEIRKSKGKNNISLDKKGVKEIENAINHLDETNRGIILLRDIEGLTYNEISEILSMNIGTVKSRLNIARNNLKNLLKF